MVSTSTLGDARRRRARRVAAMPSSRGIRTSSTTTSGRSSRARSTACRAVGGLADHLDVRRAEPRISTSPARTAGWSSATHHPDRHRAAPSSGGWRRSAAAPAPASGRRAGPAVERAAEQRGPLPHADQPGARAAARAPARPRGDRVVHCRSAPGRRRYVDRAASAAPAPCLSALVSDSCTIRYAARSTAGRQRAGRAPSDAADRQPGRPARSTSSVQRRPAAAGPSSAAGPPVRVAQQPDHLAHLGQALHAALPDHPQRRRGLRRARGRARTARRWRGWPPR